MIWHRKTAKRRLVARNAGRWANWRIPSPRNRRSATGQIVIREPEAAWWRAQHDIDRVS